MNWSLCGGLEYVQFSAPTLWPKPCSCCVDFNQELEEPHAVKFLATLLFIRKDKFRASMVARHCIPCSVEKEATCRVWNNETSFFVLLIILTTVLPKDVTWAHLARAIVNGVVCLLLPSVTHIVPGADVFCQENGLFIWLRKKNLFLFFGTPQSTRNFVWEFGNHSFKIPYRDAMPVDVTHLFQQGGQITRDINVTKSQISFFLNKQLQYHPKSNSCIVAINCVGVAPLIFDRMITEVLYCII